MSEDQTDKLQKKFDIALVAIGDILAALADTVPASKGKDDQTQEVIAIDALAEIRKVELK